MARKRVYYCVKVKIPRVQEWKDNLIFLIKICPQEFIYFDELVSMLSFLIRNGGLTKKQADWIDDEIAPLALKLYYKGYVREVV